MFVVAAGGGCAAAVVATLPAGADPLQDDAAARLCGLIHHDESPMGVIKAVDTMRSEDIPTQLLRDAVFLAFTVQCPQYTPLMEQAERSWDMHPCYNGRTGESDPLCARQQP